MRFLYLCADHGIPILGTKGASVHVREFASALIALGHSVEIVCAKLGSGNSAGALSIREITPRVLSRGHEAYVGRLRNLSRPPVSDQEDICANPLLSGELKKLEYNAQLEPALERIISEVAPDVMYERYSLFAQAGTNIAFKYRLPHILEVNAPLIQERESRLGMVLVQPAQAIEDLVFRQADAVIAVSAGVRDHVIARGEPARRVHMIPNGVDLDKFNPEIGKEQPPVARLETIGLPSSVAHTTVIGFVGSLKPWHGVDVLIKAFARACQTHPHISLLIVGEGPQLEELKREAQGTGVSENIYFVGGVPHSEIPKYVEVMDIAVAPYRLHPRFYFSPLKILEYMAMGKAVIATGQGQITDLVQDNVNGLICEPDSVDSLLGALARLIKANGLRRRLGRRAFESVAANHTWSYVADSVAALADSLLGTGRSGLVTAGTGTATDSIYRSEK